MKPFLYREITPLKIILRDIRYLPEKNGCFFLESISGYNIIDAAYPEIEGTYRLDMTTPDGFYYVQAMVDMALYAGVGWVNYYSDPATGILEKKSTFIKDIPVAGWYVGSGIYSSDLSGGNGMTPAEFNDFSFQEYVHAMAQGIAGLAAYYTDDLEFVLNACREMVHRIHFNTDGSGYFFVYNMEGVVMAHGATLLTA